MYAPFILEKVTKSREIGKDHKTLICTLTYIFTGSVKKKKRFLEGELNLLLLILRFSYHFLIL